MAAGSKGGLIVSGLLGIGLAIGLALIPQSENYTSVFGYNSVELTCGSLSHREVKVNGSLLGIGYNGSDVGSSDLYGAPIFEGKTAEKVCDSKLGSIRLWVIGGSIVGAIALMVGLATPSSSRASVTQYRSPAPSSPLVAGSTCQEGLSTRSQSVLGAGRASGSRHWATSERSNVGLGDEPSVAAREGTFIWTSAVCEQTECGRSWGAFRSANG